MAKFGLIGFAADIYGKHIKNVTIQDGQNCSKFYIENRNTLLRSRLNAVLKFVSNLDYVDKEKVEFKINVLIQNFIIRLPQLVLDLVECVYWI